MDINNLNSILENPTNLVIFILLTIWSLVWKGISLWKSAQNKHRNWFIAILVINSFGILEIVYIFYFSKSKTKEISKNIL
jgi:hypothetical protein